MHGMKMQVPNSDRIRNSIAMDYPILFSIIECFVKLQPKSFNFNKLQFSPQSHGILQLSPSTIEKIPFNPPIILYLHFRPQNNWNFTLITLMDSFIKNALNSSKPISNHLNHLTTCLFS